MTHHAFRFGALVAGARSRDEWAEKARRAEAQGYSTFLVPDTAGATLSPLVALAVAASVTDSLRLGTYVLANDYRNPVLLAQEAATLDLLSDGRFELGLGVGRGDEDYAKLGIPFDSGGVRVDRLAEALDIIDPMLRGRPSDATGRHYSVAGAQGFPPPVQQPRLPILMAGSGKRLLTLAARRADIVTVAVGSDSRVEALAERIEWVRRAAGERFGELEINCTLHAVGQDVSSPMLARFGLDRENASRSGSPYVLLGTPDQMSEQLLERRERFGASYFTVTEHLMESFAPVAERLAGH